MGQKVVQVGNSNIAFPDGMDDAMISEAIKRHRLSTTPTRASVPIMMPSHMPTAMHKDVLPPSTVTGGGVGNAQDFNQSTPNTLLGSVGQMADVGNAALEAAGAPRQRPNESNADFGRRELEGMAVGAGMSHAFPVGENGLYSNLEKIVMDHPMWGTGGKGVPARMLENVASQAPKQELEYTGFNDWIKSKEGKVTPQEFKDFMDQSRVKVNEVLKGYTEPRRLHGEEHLEYTKLNTMPDSVRTPEQETRLRELERKSMGIKDTKYQSYQLEGPKENYRELLMTLPKSLPKVVEINPYQGGGRWAVQMPDGTIASRFYDRYDAENALRFEGRQQGLTYTSSHFDEPNILAHIRYNDRIDPETGKKMLFLEEVQSDWHQQGRKEGYRQNYQYAKDEIPKGYKVLERESDPGIFRVYREGRDNPIDVFDSREDAIEYAQSHANNSGVPDAPFKTNWHELAMKRMIKHAVDNGYDSIGWTTGEQQVARYNLSKHLSELHYSGTNLKGYGHNGNIVIEHTGVTHEDLPNYIGKEAAQKLLDQTPKGTLRSLTGIDLNIGGEGMKGFYDKILPDYMNKYGKKWGTKVVKGDLSPGRMSRLGDGPWQYGTPIHKVNITPEMKAGASKGQPMFSVIPSGVVLAGLAKKGLTPPPKRESKKP